jgi:methylated-DNA-protein-cysteine methyltransferase-like protein
VGPGFNARVYAMVQRVPAGRVTTYGDVATLLGSPRVARHVGWALAALPPDRHDVPWHRVINGKGTISFRGDTWRGAHQRQRLEAEGVTFDAAGRVDLRSLRWHYGDLDP